MPSTTKINPDNIYRLLLLAVMVVGTGLWLVNWWAARPLFLDEANVARNLFDRSFLGLFRPLDHQQYAPPLYLVLAKACGELFGYSERALRLPSLLGGFAAVAGLLLASRSLRLRFWTLLPLALLFCNPMVLRYVTELKPYAVDLGVASLLLALALRPRTSFGVWIAAGMLTPWLSLPAVFVLAAVGLTKFLRDEGSRISWAVVGVSWLASFATLYVLVLAPSVSRGYLQNFHAAHFFPLPGANGYDFVQAGAIILSTVKLSFGFTFWALLFGSLLSVVSFATAPARHRWLLALPLLLVFVVSTTGRYSLIPRLLLFTLPGWWLLLAAGCQRLAEQQRWVWQQRGRLAYVLIGLMIPIVCGTRVARHFADPLRTGDDLALVTNLPVGYEPIVHYSTLPAYDYYHRINPTTRSRTYVEPRIATVDDLPAEGRYVFLFAATTHPRIVRQADYTADYAADQRAQRITTEDFYRGKRVLVDYGSQFGHNLRREDTRTTQSKAAPAAGSGGRPALLR